MPQIVISKDSEPGEPSKVEPTIYFEVVVTGGRLEIETYPSTFISTHNEYMTADAVMKELQDDFGLHSLDHVFGFLAEQSWWPEDLRVELTMYDIGRDEEE